MVRRGFSLIEIIVVVAVIAMTGFGMANLVMQRSITVRTQAADDAMQFIQKAQTLAMSNSITSCGGDIDTFYGYSVVVGANTLSLRAECKAMPPPYPTPTPIPTPTAVMPTLSDINFSTKYNTGFTLSSTPTSIIYFRAYTGAIPADTRIYIRPVVSTGFHTVIRIMKNGQISKFEEAD